MHEIVGRIARQAFLLAALWMLLRANASNFDITEYRTWIGMIIAALAAEGAGGLIGKMRAK